MCCIEHCKHILAYIGEFRGHENVRIRCLVAWKLMLDWNMFLSWLSRVFDFLSEYTEFSMPTSRD